MRIIYLILLVFSFVGAKTQDTLEDLESSHDTHQETLEKFEIQYKHIMNLKVDTAFENSKTINITDKIIKSIFYKENEEIFIKNSIKD